MAHRVCPWWLGYFLLVPLRRLAQDPNTILAPYVTAGMTVLEAGPGMGFFTLELARLVGSTGRVVAVDVQPKMLARLRRRAERVGLDQRIETRQATASGLGVGDLAGKVAFVLAFAVVHELPDMRAFFAEAARSLARSGQLFLAEPRGHLSEKQFQATVEVAVGAGLVVIGRPEIRRSRTVLLVRV